MSNTAPSPLSPPNPNKNNRCHSFASPQSLSEWLKPRLPSDSFASWGVKPGTKNIHNLWLELSEGETSIDDSNPPVRTVQVVMVRITGKDGKFLVESHQELSNGNVTERNRPLTEKMKSNEVPESTALRGIKEELGSVIDAETEICDIVTIDRNSYEMRVEERNSETYPGLPGCYVFHTFYATVEGLPEGDFCSYEVDEYADSDHKIVADKAVSVKKHFWKWAWYISSYMGVAYCGWCPNGTDPIMSMYSAGYEINQLQWSAANPDWIEISFANKMHAAFEGLSFRYPSIDNSFSRYTLLEPLSCV